MEPSVLAQASDITNIFLERGVLGAVAIVLAGVVIYQQRKLDIKDSEIKSLNSLLLSESKSHAQDYREMARNDQEVLLGTSQSNQLLAAKIEAVKGK